MAASSPPRFFVSSPPRSPSFHGCQILSFSCPRSLRSNPSLPAEDHHPHPSVSLLLTRAQSVIHQLSAFKQLLLPHVSLTLLNEFKSPSSLQPDDEMEPQDKCGENTVTASSLTAESLELLELSIGQSRYSSRTMENPSSSAQQNFDKVPELLINTRGDTDLSLDETLLFPRCSWPRDEGKPVRVDLSNLQSSPFPTRAAPSPDSPYSLFGVTLREKSTRYKPGEVEVMGGARCAWPRSVPCNTSQAPNQSVQCCGYELKSGKVSSTSSISQSQQSFLSQTERSEGSGSLGRNKASPVSQIQFNQSSNNGAAISNEWAVPRCAWPRVPARLGSKLHPYDKHVNSTIPSAEGTVVEGGAKCAWPRIRSKASVDLNANSITSSHSPITASEEQLAAGPRCAWPKPGTAGFMALVEKKQGNLDKLSPPPKDFPRRMLTTSVGLSLMNFLLVAQGAAALANPGDFLQEKGVPIASGEHVQNGRTLIVQ